MQKQSLADWYVLWVYMEKSQYFLEGDTWTNLNSSIERQFYM